jgi:hypothetical protein
MEQIPTLSSSAGPTVRRRSQCGKRETSIVVSGEEVHGVDLDGLEIKSSNLASVRQCVFHHP